MWVFKKNSIVVNNFFIEFTENVLYQNMFWYRKGAWLHLEKSLIAQPDSALNSAPPCTKNASFSDSFFRIPLMTCVFKLAY